MVFVLYIINCNKATCYKSNVLQIYVFKLLVETLKLMQRNSKICKAKRKEVRKFLYAINNLVRLRQIFRCEKQLVLNILR